MWHYVSCYGEEINSLECLGGVRPDVQKIFLLDLNVLSRTEAPHMAGY